MSETIGVTGVPTLEMHARAVALARLALAGLEISRKAAQASFESKYENLLDQHQRAKDAVERAEANLRHAAEVDYTLTKNKQPFAGVTIRMVQKVEYDPKEALGWARQSGLALALDKKSYESIAKTNAGQPGGPPGTVTIEPHAQISENLGELLGITTQQENQVHD